MQMMWAVVAALFGIVGTVLGIALGIAAASLYYRDRMIRADQAAEAWAAEAVADGDGQPEAESLPVGQRRDNLKRIVGIGAVFERRLNEAGIMTFADLAALTPEEVAAAVDIEVGATRIVDDDWIGQAADLVD